jgi:hypothetical protein
MLYVNKNKKTGIIFAINPFGRKNEKSEYNIERNFL